MVHDTLERETASVKVQRRGWSIYVGSVGQIPIRIHLTFVALLAWLLFGRTSTSPISETLFVIMVFVCVLLHELGHALVAKRFDVQTRDITLYPFGGVAAIVSQPSPRGELVIAIAGPLVNVVIAAIIYPWITIPELQQLETATALSLPLRLFFTNVALAVFNLLPALPMDGGRVLRACLSLCNVKEATMVAARISQALCVLLAITGLYLAQPMLFIISIIVFLGAMQEYVRAETKVIASAFTIEEAMIPKERLESFPHGTTISRALRTALTSWQPLYPILNGDALLGVVMREDLLEHAAMHSDDYVGEIMQRSIPEVDIATPLADACAQMETSAKPILAVQQEGHYAGLLVYDRLSDFLVIHELRHRLPKDEDIEWTAP